MMFKILGKMKNKRGFTLIELMVVIAVLGIIVAMVAPRFLGMKNKAQDEVDKASVKMAKNAIKIEFSLNGATTWDKDDPTVWSKYLEVWPDGLSTKQIVIDSDGDITTPDE